MRVYEEEDQALLAHTILHLHINYSLHFYQN